jgi:hypothetical protein
MPEENPPAGDDDVPPPDPELEAVADHLRGILIRLLDRTGGGPSRGDLEELAGLVRHIGRHGDEAARRVAARMPEVPAPDLRHAADSAKAIFLGACLQVPFESITDVTRLFREDLGVAQGFALGTWEEIKEDPLLKAMLDTFMDVEGEYCKAGGEPADAPPETRAPRRKAGRRPGGKGRQPAR